MIKASTLSDRVYECLLRKIWADELKPGSRLLELDLAAQLGVSRTPIREALVRLMENGFVEARSDRSMRLRSLQRREVVQIYRLREVLECWAVKLACGRIKATELVHLEELAAKVGDEADPHFERCCFQLDLYLHRLTAKRSGNRFLAQEIRRLHDLIQLSTKPVGGERRGEVRLFYHEHVRILAALKARDARAAQEAMRMHLRSVCALRLTHYPREGPAQLNP